MSFGDVNIRFESQLSRMNCQMFHRVEFGRGRWQQQDGNVGRDHKPVARVPAGLAHQQDSMCGSQVRVACCNPTLPRSTLVAASYTTTWPGPSRQAEEGMGR